MNHRRPNQIDVQLRAQVVSLRRAGLAVSEIADRLKLTRLGDIEAIRLICDKLPRKYGVGEVAPRGVVYRRTRGDI